MLCPYEICKTVVMQAKVTEVPPPCYPASLLVATIEAPSKNSISIVWSGNTMPFKNNFESLGVGGKTLKRADSDSFGEYFRKKDNICILSAEDREQVLPLLGDNLLRGAPVVVQIRDPPNEDDAFQELLKELQKMENCFFS